MTLLTNQKVVINVVIAHFLRFEERETGLESNFDTTCGLEIGTLFGLVYH